MFKFRKAIQGVNLLASLSGGSESKMKIVKLLWLADRMHIRLHGRPITYDKYNALPHGPVPSYTLDLINGNFDWRPVVESVYRNRFISLDEHNNSMVHSKNEPDMMVFSDSDEEVLRYIFDEFHHHSASKLRKISHKYPEWVRWKELIEDENRGSSYTMEYVDFFSNPGIENDVFIHLSNQDILESSMALFLDDQQIRQNI